MGVLMWSQVQEPPLDSPPLTSQAISSFLPTLILFSANRYLLSIYYMPGTGEYRSQQDKNLCLQDLITHYREGQTINVWVGSRKNSLRRWHLSLAYMISLFLWGRPGSALLTFPFSCPLLTIPQLCSGQQWALPRWLLHFPRLYCTQSWPRRPTLKSAGWLRIKWAFKDKKRWLVASNCLPLVAWRK